MVNFSWGTRCSTPRHGWNGHCLLALAACFPALVSAQTFYGSGAAIPDDGDALEVPLAVTGLTLPLDTIAFGLEEVCFTIEHSWVGDLELQLIAPDGTAGLLVANQGGSSDEFDGTCLRSGSTTSILAADPPYAGTFRPQGQMGAVNNGQNGNGTWTLRVLDTYPFADEGTLLSWSLTFGADPADYFSFQSCDLPLLIINTNGQSIPEGTKITAAMGLVDNGPEQLNRPDDPFNAYDGSIGIELRGNSSLSMSPKRSFNVELRDEQGDDIDSALLGMPAEADWVLSANYFDKSFINNALSFHLARQMGRYAPRTRHVELMLNGQYQGVYVLMERIKQGPGRVDIADLQQQDIAGDQLTGGYILSVDREEGDGEGFTSTFPPVSSGNGQQTYLRYRYPKGEDIQSQQAAYIQQFIQGFESALDGPQFLDPSAGYRAWADAASFIDLLLLNEISRNVDGYRLSSYLYKDKDSNGGKLTAGPAWDYDIAWGNADYCDGAAIDGWAHDFASVCGGDGNQVPFWWSRMLEDPQFVAELRCRWNELRASVLSPPNIDQFCDSVANLVSTAQVRNFAVWPILGIYVWPNPSPIPDSYAEEVEELKDWALARWTWLNANLPGACTADMWEGHADRTSRVFPTHFVDHVTLRDASGHGFSMELHDARGTIVHARSYGPSTMDQLRIDLPADLSGGIYLLRLRRSDGAVIDQVLVH